MDKTDIPVTVLMAVFNGEGLLNRAVDSVLSQSFREFEFIIINDASTDRSREVILSYNDPRIRLIDNPGNAGLTRSLNLGLKEARGEFIARMDVDDICLPGRLDAQVSALKSSRADICFCNCLFVDRESGREWRWVPKKGSLLRWRSLFENSFGVHPAAMFRKNRIAEIGGYDSEFRYSQDYDLWSRCAELGMTFEYAGGPFLKYFLHSGGVSRSKKSEQAGFARRVSIRSLGKLLPDKDPDALNELLKLYMRSSEERPSDMKALLPLCLDLIAAYQERIENGNRVEV